MLLGGGALGTPENGRFKLAAVTWDFVGRVQEAFGLRLGDSGSERAIAREEHKMRSIGVSGIAFGFVFRRELRGGLSAMLSRIITLCH